MAEEKKSPSCCVIICGDDKGCRILKCESEEAKELLAKFRECCDDSAACCDDATDDRS